LKRSGVFSITVILIVAVGIGTSSAVFSMVDRLLFRSLPYPDAPRLASIGMDFVLMADGAFMVANNYLHLRELQTGFQEFTPWRGISECDLTELNPRRMACAEI
jgi:putative ABC transport system permease protein